jgi:hypothetical protein
MEFVCVGAVPEVFVEHKLKQSNIALTYVLGQQQKLGKSLFQMLIYLSV